MQVTQLLVDRQTAFVIAKGIGVVGCDADERALAGMGVLDNACPCCIPARGYGGGG